VHVHFRNLRFELHEVDFLQLCSAFFLAQRRLWRWYKAPHFEIIPIDKIDPWDAVHCPSEKPPGFVCKDNKDTFAHLEGIKFFMQKLRNNEQVSPILVRPHPQVKGKYQRMDGFKRFMAYKFLGFKEIPCIIDLSAIPGG